MLRWIGVVAVGLALVAGPTRAQDSAGVLVAHGMDGDLAAGMLAAMGAARQTRDTCWNLGCLVIVNETHSYDVVGFYIDTAKPGHEPRWSGNQFPGALRPMKATLRFKTAPASACALPVRLVLRRRGAKDQLDVSGTVPLCSTPHQDTLLRVKVAEPSVTVEGGDDDRATTVAPPTP